MAVNLAGRFGDTFLLERSLVKSQWSRGWANEASFNHRLPRLCRFSMLASNHMLQLPRCVLEIERDAVNGELRCFFSVDVWVRVLWRSTSPDVSETHPYWDGHWSRVNGQGAGLMKRRLSLGGLILYFLLLYCHASSFVICKNHGKHGMNMEFEDMTRAVTFHKT